MKPDGIYLIGLTGNIACGKSTVVSLLKKSGAHAIDADKVTRQLQEPGNMVYQNIVATFGPAIIPYPNGPIDRAKLGAIVFGNPSELAKLEHIVHPAVHAEIVSWLKHIAHIGGPHPVAVVDAIKLLETGWKSHCDAIWVVACRPEQQLERLIQGRGMTEAEAQQRISAQSAQAEKIALADVVIDNSGTLEQTSAQVAQAWKHIHSQTS